MRMPDFPWPVRLCCVCLNGMLTWRFFAYFTFENHLYHLDLIRVTFGILFMPKSRPPVEHVRPIGDFSCEKFRGAALVQVQRIVEFHGVLSTRQNLDCTRDRIAAEQQV